jgi:hypothetical protein
MNVKREGERGCAGYARVRRNKPLFSICAHDCIYRNHRAAKQWPIVQNDELSFYDSVNDTQLIDIKWNKKWSSIR